MGQPIIQPTECNPVCEDNIYYTMYYYGPDPPPCDTRDWMADVISLEGRYKWLGPFGDPLKYCCYEILEVLDCSQSVTGYNYASLWHCIGMVNHEGELPIDITTAQAIQAATGPDKLGDTFPGTGGSNWSRFTDKQTHSRLLVKTIKTTP